jgi:hypothetical protein
VILLEIHEDKGFYIKATFIMILSSNSDGANLCQRKFNPQKFTIINIIIILRCVILIYARIL